MTEFDMLGTAAAGMDAQRFALDVAARNVAAAEVSTPEHPFGRLVAQFTTGASDPDAAAADGFEVADGDAAADASDAEPPGGDGSADDDAFVRPAGTRLQTGVDADVVSEMVAVLNAQRSYEANASVFDAGKRLAERTIDMGRL